MQEIDGQLGSIREQLQEAFQKVFLSAFLGRADLVKNGGGEMETTETKWHCAPFPHLSLCSQSAQAAAPAPAVEPPAAAVEEAPPKPGWCVSSPLFVHGVHMCLSPLCITSIHDLGIPLLQVAAEHD